MSDLQPSHLPPSPDDASHAQIMRLSANYHIDVGQTSADEQNGKGPTRSVDGSKASSGPSTNEQNDKKSSADESSDDGTYIHGSGYFLRRWWDARLQGTLPLALSVRIPLEVFEFIIDAMDPPILTAAALVCAAWYPQAMHNLYHTIEICSRTSYNMLFKQCQASPRVKQWLASTCKLSVDEGSANDSLCLLQALPSAFAGLMPHVRILDIRDARLRFIRMDFFLALLRFESVKSLTLFQCKLNNMTQLRRIVSAFPQLTDLTMVVGFAQRGAASHAGASLSRPPPQMRLRCLDVDVDDERMMMFLDWMSCSDLCTSLANLTFRSVAPSTTWQAPLNQLLETAGASLTRFSERYFDGNTLAHGNLLQNTALQSLDFKLHYIDHTAESQWPRPDWTKATDELHGIFCTIRSRQLEHIEFSVWVEVDDSIFESEEPSAVLEKLDLQDLHEVMIQPYFDTLKDVKVKVDLYHEIDETKSDVDSIAQKLQAMFHGILQPWSARGIVTVTNRN